MCIGLTLPEGCGLLTRSRMSRERMPCLFWQGAGASGFRYWRLCSLSYVTPHSSAR